MPDIRYFAQVGGERIELGQNPDLKEDPFKPLQTGREVDHWEVQLETDETRYVAVSHDSLKDAAARLLKKLPEDIAAPDTIKKAGVADQVKGGAGAEAKK